MIRYLTSCCFLLLSLIVAPACADILYGVGHEGDDGSSNLFRIDDYETAPTMVDLGELGDVYHDIAYNAITGKTYGITSTNQIREINLVTLETALILNAGNGLINSMDFDANGIAYLYRARIAEGTGRLISANLDTEETGTIGSEQPFVPAGDLSFDSEGRLYLTTTSRRFVEIDPITGLTTDIGPTRIGTQSWGMDQNSSGVIYASSFPDLLGGPEYKLFEMDPVTGGATDMFGQIITNSADIGVNGLTFVTPVPEPGSTFFLLIISLIPLSTQRRVQR